ncbi:uncharacterized protein LOC116620835 [Nematostella vectensis]|uniref:uncharacterized protein LOC116620835 n=1 Tax=Nematostella vectensis TaxID=45351 RepID=UPI0020772CC9|nr:uncharacterized protein LOC116620835 [Nematostella vectensis]
MVINARRTACVTVLSIVLLMIGNLVSSQPRVPLEEREISPWYSELVRIHNANEMDRENMQKHASGELSRKSLLDTTATRFYIPHPDQGRKHMKASENTDNKSRDYSMIQGLHIVYHNQPQNKFKTQQQLITHVVLHGHEDESNNKVIKPRKLADKSPKELTGIKSQSDKQEIKFPGYHNYIHNKHKNQEKDQAIKLTNQKRKDQTDSEMVAEQPDLHVTGSTKRKFHKVARRFFTIPWEECLIINENGKIQATLSQSDCAKYGTFCEINNGGNINLKSTTGDYFIAINNTGQIYAESSQTKDTNLTTSIADLFNFTVNIYRIVDNTRCYLNVSSTRPTTNCSRKPFALQSRIVGTCK